MRARALAALPLIALGCGLTTITLEEEATAVVPAGNILQNLVGELGFGDFFSARIIDSQELQNQGVTADQINSIHLTALVLTVTSPQGGDLTFLDELTFYVEADGLPRQAIAAGGPFPAGQAEVSLDLMDVDLAPYAVKDSLVIDTEVVGHSPQEETTVQAFMELEVDVNARGAACGG